MQTINAAELPEVNMENEIMTIEEFKEHTGLNRYQLEWWQSSGLFGLESDLGIDRRWMSVWDDHKGYLEVGFSPLEALARSCDHVFGRGTYESIETLLQLSDE
jgi:hypothetical protein